MNQGTPISLTDEQRIELERRVRSQTLDAHESCSWRPTVLVIMR